ncbi:hypothetical protein [Micromonospora tarensis]|uniref:PPE family protein n=1 Tax=Micromonospora tarensis TaxID=2806100 RepID=A0ABS1YCQ4_9ACTN|nr:hypothetical protein [Micromonospora tarensis]MBM0275142.1 hypothetical protein [Micromonospora tarensis]
MGTLRLTASTREWLDSRRAKLRTAATRCDAASRDYNRRDAELTDLAERSGWDDLKTDKVKAANRGLTAAYGATTFWQQEVQRLAADIQAELAYQRAMADAADEPSPSWPAAADRTVPRPSYRPRPYATDDAGAVRLGGLVEPAPLIDPALRDTNSPTGPSPSGLPHVSGPVGGKQGAAAMGVTAAPTPTEGGAR